MKKNRLFSIVFLLFGITTVQAQLRKPNDNSQLALSNIDKQYFIENKGQWPSEVLYLTQMGGLNTWITTKGMLYEFFKTEKIKETSIMDAMPDKFDHKEYKRLGHRVGYKLIGNNALVNTHGKQKQQGYYNYLVGNDPGKHASNVGLYKEAVVKDVYNGIDMRYYFDKSLLRYDYIVNPGADPNQIQFSLAGSEKTYLNEKGELVFTTCFGEVKNSDLYCYQQQDKKPVASQFTKQGENFVIALGTYNKSQTLIIDPLIYSTYIGGGVSEYGRSIALDFSGNSYITGYTNSIDYDTTTGAFQTTLALVPDAFVTKLNATGTGLIYSTYIGGSNVDVACSIDLDASANAYITGYTTSNDYDITPGTFQTTRAGLRDVFVTKLNSAGTALIYSTYIGGPGSDEGADIALDASGNAYITGHTAAANYDITSGTFQTASGGGDDVIVTKLNSTGTALIFSTYIGGTGSERGTSISLDTLGNAFITGYTASPNYPITSGAFQTTHEGIYDVFITKLNANGTSLNYSTFIGGSGEDTGNSITLDGLGNSYITGYTNSADYDITAGAFQTNLTGSKNIIVTKLNSTGTALIYSSYIGGSGYDVGNSIDLDSLNNAYITGNTSSTNFDITVGAFQTTNTGLVGSTDVFVSKLNAAGTNLVYSTYIGGSDNDESNSISIDATGNVFISGVTYSTDYDTTLGAYQTTREGFNDAFVTKLDMAGTSSIGEITKNDWNTVFPNPSDGIYQLAFKNTISEPLLIEAFDIQGKLVSSQSFSSENFINIDISNEPDGLYILIVKAKHTQEVVRLVKL